MAGNVKRSKRSRKELRGVYRDGRTYTVTDCGYSTTFGPEHHAMWVYEFGSKKPLLHVDLAGPITHEEAEALIELFDLAANREDREA